MDIEKNGNYTKFHLGTKEFISIVILVIVILITIKPELLVLVTNQITKLISTPGFNQFVSMITTIIDTFQN